MDLRTEIIYFVWISINSCPFRPIPSNHLAWCGAGRNCSRFYLKYCFLLVFEVFVVVDQNKGYFLLLLNQLVAEWYLRSVTVASLQYQTLRFRTLKMNGLALGDLLSKLGNSMGFQIISQSLTDIERSHHTISTSAKM